MLGQNAGARALEEFDTARGYALPLFFGNWTPTRALETVDFETAPPSVRAQWGAADSGWLRLEDGAALEVPWAFPLPEGDTWRLSVVGRGPGFPQYGKKNPRSSTLWKTIFHSVEKSDFRANGGWVEIRRVKLERKTRHVFDSQLVRYIGRLLRLDFGVSTSLNQPVARLLRRGIGPSLALTVPILLVELVVSLVLALLCAYRRGSWLDRSLVALCVGLMSVNYLVWIVIGQFVFAYKLGWFPVWGFESWRNLLLPVAIGVATGLGVNVRFYRTILLEEMHKDYVKSAFAKGLGPGRVLFKHVLKNALGPVITNVALALPFLYTGSVLLESFFGIPGLGYLSLNAIHSSDVEVVRAVVLVGALLFTLANIVADIALAWVDPRVSLA
ncbi:MAG: ABC transporter permease [Kiritimatiellae bacterium]|nr:ABC transporter permease [Kiritimatiellia bacterium]